MGRARQLGSLEPEHYLIPTLCQSIASTHSCLPIRLREYDPNKPTKGWRNLTKTAKLQGLRGHDLRHNWITSHAEIGTPQSVLEAQAGHLSKRVSDRYKHISERVARKASDELARVRAEQRREARAKLSRPGRETELDRTAPTASSSGAHSTFAN